MKQNFSSITDLIDELKRLLILNNIEDSFKITEQKFPFGFIIGNPRSGTTFFTECLANSGCFSYPTNTLARFSYAPYIGALVQQLLFNKDFDPLNELNYTDSSILFNSNLGKTSGFLAPNEFQHFFRNYISNYFPEYIKQEEFKTIDFEDMKRNLCLIENVFQKPFITKAIMVQYNLADFYKEIPNSIFFYLKRDPFYVMQSIYMAREKYYGDLSKWWSVKPKEYESLKNKDVYHQIAGQVYHTDLSIQQSLEQIPEDKKLLVDYEDFCENPQKYFQKIKELYKEKNIEFISDNISNDNLFQNSNSLKIEKSEFNRLKDAYIDLKESL